MRAKKLNIPFGLDITDCIVPAKCPVFGTPLKSGVDGKITNDSPTLDKIVPSKGYVKGNVAIISQKANRLKNSASPDELLAISSWVQKRIS